MNAYLTHFAISPDKLSETDTYGVAIAQIQAEKVKVITRYILIFLAIVAFLLLLFTRIPGPAANKLNSAGAGGATSDAAPGSSESIVRDFTTGPFKKDFYDDIRQTAKAKAETAGNLNIEKLVVIHFIRDEFQIGFRAYKGISLMRRDTDGVLPLYVSTTFGGPSLTVDYFDWGDNEARPTIRSRPTVQPNRRPIVTVNANAGPRNLSIFKFYDDPGRSDGFHVNPFPAGSNVPLNHYVVVRNEDLSKWNPNKFVFEAKPDGTIDFSSAVYVTATPSNPILRDAEEILSKFIIPIPDSTLLPQAKEHFNTVKERINEIFHENSFRENVTVFWLEQKASETNLVLGYVFPRKFP